MLRLNHNYHELSPIERIEYWLRIRRGLTVQDRFFFEGHRPLPGQIYLAERRALYAAVLSRRPKYCFEVGTASGGGSTFFIAAAFRELGSGQLISLESDASLHLTAARRYRQDLAYLRPYVQLLHGESPESFLPYIEAHESVAECIFLDGSDTPEEAASQYQFFLPYVRPGTILMAHDWGDVKMSILRPLVERDESWLLRTRLSWPESVGFVVYVQEGAPR